MPIPAQTFALVIGINVYQSPDYADLTAAVNDANTMDEYLQNTLLVPPSSIINLRDTEASRVGILEGFHKLQDISKDATDPCFIIFYAGHGARANKPAEWKDWESDSDQVEVLCPSDVGVEREDGGVVEGIPDRTVCYLLNQLSKLRGNNITLILDCCCSAGLNRGSGSSDIVARQIMNPPPLTSKTDADIPIPPPAPKRKNSKMSGLSASLTRSLKASSGFGGKFQDSHVLLAACGRDRVAFEKDGHGLFTSALMSVLPQIDETTTYFALMKRLKAMPPWQVPHCEGSSADRPIFNVRGERADPSFISGERHKKAGENFITVTMEAGLAQGVALGELYSIHETNFTSSKSLGTLITTTVHTSHSTLDHRPGVKPFKIPKTFYAKLVEWSSNAPKVYCKDRSWLKTVFPKEKGQIIAVKDPAEASLIIALDGRKVTISRTDDLINTYVPTPFGHVFEKDAHDDIRLIVNAWQHFDYHLNRKGKNVFNSVRMEMHYLDPIEEVNPYEAEVYRPVGENLLAQEPAKLHLANENDKPVGVTLYNESDTPLYPYLFYFDPNTLCIHEWFSGPQGAGQGNIDPPLGAQSRLPIGHGNGAQPPWQFCFEEDRTKDIGFFKLFLTTTPTNFSSIKREDSPFDKVGKSKTRGHSPLPPTIDLPEEEVIDSESWGVKVATLIQLKVPKDGDSV